MSLFISVHVYLSVFLSVCEFFVIVSLSLQVSLSIYKYFCISVSVSVRLFVYSFPHNNVQASVLFAFGLSVCLFLHPKLRIFAMGKLLPSVPVFAHKFLFASRQLFSSFRVSCKLGKRLCKSSMSTSVPHIYLPMFVKANFSFLDLF